MDAGGSGVGGGSRDAMPQDISPERHGWIRTRRHSANSLASSKSDRLCN